MHFKLLSVTSLMVMAGAVSASTLIQGQGPPCTVTSGSVTTVVEVPFKGPTTVTTAYNGNDPCAPDAICTPGTTTPASGSGGFITPVPFGNLGATFTFSGTTIVGVSKCLWLIVFNTDMIL